VTEATARTVSSLVLASAGAAAAYVILTTPSLRRLVWTATERWLGNTPQGFVAAQLREAWAESGRTADN
jgi:hypothetical protein